MESQGRLWPGGGGWSFLDNLGKILGPGGIPNSKRRGKKDHPDRLDNSATDKRATLGTCQPGPWGLGTGPGADQADFAKRSCRGETAIMRVLFWGSLTIPRN